MANNFTGKDASLATQTFKSTDNSGVHTPHVNIDTVAGTIPVTDNGGSLTVDNTTLSVVGGGTEATALRVTIASDSTGVLSIDDNGGSITVDGSLTSAGNVTNTGTFAVQETGAALTSLQLMDDWDNAASDGASVSGDVSHDSVDAGEPVKIGFKAYNQDGTVPGTAVAEGDRVNGIADVYGRQYVSTDHPYFFRASENNSTAQTNNELVAAPGAGLSLYITDIVVSNGATAGSIRLVEDTAGTPVIIMNELYMAVNGGAVMQFKTPLKLTANKNLGYTSTSVTTHTITVSGYIAP